MLERGGEVRAQVISNSRSATLIPNIRKHVEKGSRLYTDEENPYAFSSI
jgi:transposase-like protein